MYQCADYRLVFAHADEVLKLEHGHDGEDSHQAAEPVWSGEQGPDYGSNIDDARQRACDNVFHCGVIAVACRQRMMTRRLSEPLMLIT